MTGEIAALSAALCWALASIFFADIGVRIRALNLNIIKGVIGSLMMICVLITGSLAGIASISLQTLTEISPHSYILLIMSGIIGISIGDSAYFGCLRRIGPQKGLMLESTAPVIAAVLAILLFEEYLPGTGWLGIWLTSIGVILVIRFSHSQRGYTNSKAGIALGLLAAAAQAAGIVLSRMALAGGLIEPLASSLIRLMAALVIMAVSIGIIQLLARPVSTHQPLWQAVQLIRQHHLSKKLFCAVCIGTFVALWLQQVSVKHTSAGIAQTLLATCPLFGMLIGVFQGQKQSPRIWFGLLVSFAGISLLFLF